MYVFWQFTEDLKEKIRYSRIRKVDCFPHEHARTAAAAAALLPSLPRVSAAFPTRPQRRSCAPLREGEGKRGGTKRKRMEGWMVEQTDRGTKSDSSF